MLLKKFSILGKAWAWSDGTIEIFIELISFFSVVIEDKGLEEDRRDKKHFSDKGYESHKVTKFVYKLRIFNIQIHINYK